MQIRRGGEKDWQEAAAFAPLAAGDKVRTSSRGTAEVTFQDGSRVDLESSTVFEVEELSDARIGLRLNLGKLKAWVERLLSRKFEVQTPTAVCSVRGTEFSVQVIRDGRTAVELYRGLLAVEDLRGNAVLLDPNQKDRVEVDQGGRMEEP